MMSSNFVLFFWMHTYVHTQTPTHLPRYRMTSIKWTLQRQQLSSFKANVPPPSLLLWGPHNVDLFPLNSLAPSPVLQHHVIKCICVTKWERYARYDFTLLYVSWFMGIIHKYQSGIFTVVWCKISVPQFTMSLAVAHNPPVPFFVNLSLLKSVLWGICACVQVCAHKHKHIYTHVHTWYIDT